MGISKRFATFCTLSGADPDRFMIDGKTKVNRKLFGLEEVKCIKEKSTRKKSCRSSGVKDATSVKQEKTLLSTEETPEQI